MENNIIGIEFFEKELSRLWKNFRRNEAKIKMVILDMAASGNSNNNQEHSEIVVDDKIIAYFNEFIAEKERLTHQIDIVNDLKSNYERILKIQEFINNRKNKINQMLKSEEYRKRSFDFKKFLRHILEDSNINNSEPTKTLGISCIRKNESLLIGKELSPLIEKALRIITETHSKEFSYDNDNFLYISVVIFFYFNSSSVGLISFSFEDYFKNQLKSKEDALELIKLLSSNMRLSFSFFAHPKLVNELENEIFETVKKQEYYTKVFDQKVNEVLSTFREKTK